MDGIRNGSEVPDRRREILEALTKRITIEKKNGAPYVIAIDGKTGVGKTEIANDLAATLITHGKKVQIIHMDDYLNPSSIRYGIDESTDFYTRSFNFRKLLSVLSEIRKNGCLQRVMPLFDTRADTDSKPVPYDIDKDTVVIVEGVFLHKDIFENCFNLSVFLTATSPAALRRAQDRNAADPLDRNVLSPEEMERRYWEKYDPGFNMYAERANPVGNSTVLLDFEDPKHPRVLAARQKI